MKLFSSSFVIVLFTVLGIGTSSDLSKYVYPSEMIPDTWNHLHKGDKNLAGVAMRFESTYKEGDFPYLVFYVFWDGRIRQIEHDKLGAVLMDFWWEQSLERDSTMWIVVNYELGSDPLFETHKDPRKNVDSSSIERLTPRRKPSDSSQPSASDALNIPATPTPAK